MEENQFSLPELLSLTSDVEQLLSLPPPQVSTCPLASPLDYEFEEMEEAWGCVSVPPTSASKPDVSPEAGLSVNSTSRERSEPPASAEVVRASEEIYRLRLELAKMREEFASTLANLDLKRVKKNRTTKNRCTFINRRGDSCRGYICKVEGSRLCYAHHVLAMANEYPEKRKKLY